MGNKCSESRSHTAIILLQNTFDTLKKDSAAILSGNPKLYVH